MHVSLLKWIEEQQETRKGEQEKKHWHNVGISPQNIVSVQRQPLFQLPNLTDSKKKGYLHEKQKSKIKPWLIYSTFIRIFQDLGIFLVSICL